MNKNKAKGNAFERKIVNLAKEHGLEAKRAYASNGLALGKDKECDLLINNLTIQCKKGYNHPSARLKDFLINVDACIWSPTDSRKYPNSDYVFMTVESFFKLLK